MTEDLQSLVGKRVAFSKTVSESDVYLFAGITGDLAPNHVDEKFMRGTQFGRRIAHGALLVGYMSRCSTAIADGLWVGGKVYPVSLGYDRVRFLKPVFIGDTIAISYEIARFDTARQRTEANVEVRGEADEVAAAATHIMKWLSRS